MRMPRNSKSLKILIVSAALSLGGCESMNDLNTWIKENPDSVRLALLGGFGGAIAGAELGGSALAMALGGTVGLAIGWNVGDMLFEEDKSAFGKAVSKAATTPTTDKIEWRNPKTGNQGTAQALGDLRITAYGDQCRDIEASVQTKDGARIEIRTVCRQPDGNWRVVG